MAQLAPYRILQIMPAPVGMRAKYTYEEDGKTSTEVLPIVCLALIDEGGDTYVRSMVAWDGGEIEFADDPKNFAGYLHQGEELKTP